MNEAPVAKDKGEAPFNMAMLHYINLNKLIELKDKAYIDNDLKGWYKGLDRIYLKIVFKLNEKEVNEIEGLFKGAKNALDQRRYKEAPYILHRIDKLIVIFMDKYKMIFPNILVQGGMDILKSRYGLEAEE